MDERKENKNDAGFDLSHEEDGELLSFEMGKIEGRTGFRGQTGS